MVPSGWEIKTLGEITKWSSGGTPSKAKPEYWNGDIPWISAASMKGHYFDSSELFITEAAKNNRAKMAPIYSILLLVRGSMLWNKIPVGITTQEVAFNQDVKCLQPHNDKIASIFLLYWFLAHENKLMHMVTGTGIGAGKLDTDELRSLDIGLPPLPEQKKIAEILSTWDKAITTTEQLLANSQQQKKALMQQLLTGKKRLLDDNGQVFSEEWEEIKLGDLGNTFTGLTGKTKDDFGSGATYIPYMNIFTNTAIKLSHLERVDVKEDEKQNMVRRGDIFFTTSSETPEEVGMSSVLLENPVEPTYLNSFCFGFRPKSFEHVNPEFMQFCLRSAYSRREISKLAQGATRYNLSKNNLMKVVLHIPMIEEQQKIAVVLTAADQEIDTLKQKLDHLRQEKKALMQQLLTGKQRVIV